MPEVWSPSTTARAGERWRGKGERGGRARQRYREEEECGAGLLGGRQREGEDECRNPKLWYLYMSLVWATPGLRTGPKIYHGGPYWMPATVNRFTVAGKNARHGK